MSTWAVIRSWPRRLLGRQRSVLLDPAANRHLVYEGKPVWWARWTWALVGMDLFLVSSMAEVTWNHWTHLETSEPDAKQKNYVLRPAWQRFCLAAGQFGAGLALAVTLVRLRGKAIRKLYIIPPKDSSLSASEVPKHSQVLIQTPVQSSSSCIKTTLAQCELSPGRDLSEVIMRLRGNDSEFWMEMHGAKIRGKEMPLEKANGALWEAFTGKKAISLSGWISGPILQ
ncbi:hypothetical protein NEOLEDRAFT_1074101 [Neolentinus lepideus HHB14362 ss-1]|uniref:Uncharacterized protein n=1 Tax=Neolentinus lepideus HHB14362 ss-1 TaxID=1314782 RepID=A0A165PIU7_9AGAM|nr:hypothetical protein NEOLEDRAFT_1074101 [Neolentinus lepideus HHB14362 ss-1]